MIVGVGRLPKGFADRLRKHVSHPSVFIYPEFMDDKRSLVSGNRVMYVQRLFMDRGSVVIALWPDYCHDHCANRLHLNLLDDIVWVFPLHDLSEIDFVLRYIDRVFPEYLVGYASDPNLRSYTLERFIDACKTYGLPMWYLGASSREVYEAVKHRFNGIDVTTLSVPGWRYGCNTLPDAPKQFATWLHELAEGRVLRSYRCRVVKCVDLPT